MAPYASVHPNNYTLGRGEIWFAPFVAGFTPGPEMYIGQTNEVNVNIEQESLDHFNSDYGVREKDKTIPLEVTRMVTFTAEDIQMRNLRYFFFGTSETTSVAGATVTAETLTAPIPGAGYTLGMNATRITGYAALDPDTPPVVTQGSTTLVENTDYIVDYKLARIIVLPNPSANFTPGTDLSVDYTTLAYTREMVISGNKAVEGVLRYISNNPTGERRDWFFPWAQIKPNGDFALKGEEWQAIPFTVEALKRPGAEAIYVSGEPLTS